MITFILLAMAAIVVIAALVIAYSANQRKRAGQSGEGEVQAQQHGSGSPTVGRSTGIN